MKIIQIIPYIGSGGAERFVVDLSNELAQIGHEVLLCTLYAMDGSMGFYKRDINHKVKVVTLNKGLGLSLRTIMKFMNVVKKEKPDLIHSHIGALQYSFLSQVFQSRGYHTVHNEAHLEAKGYLEILLRKFAFKLGLVTPITVSKESHDSFVSFYNKNAYQINNGRSISNIIVSQRVKDEIKSYMPNDNTRVIVQVARFQEQKNIPLMARVTKRLYNDGYNFSLLFIGNTEKTQIREEVEREKSVCAHILGERHNPLEYLKEAGCFALSSLYEGMPISLIEAFSVGAIPVCTPVGGIPNAVINGENGILSKDTSEDAYYEALKAYLEMPDDQVQLMREKALRSYEPYNMTECAKKYMDVFMENEKIK